ncbi:MAG: hypothetical protein ACTHL8_03205 [Burkholderiaceae bacterium]
MAGWGPAGVCVLADGRVPAGVCVLADGLSSVDAFVWAGVCVLADGFVSAAVFVSAGGWGTALAGGSCIALICRMAASRSAGNALRGPPRAELD